MVNDYPIPLFFLAFVVLAGTGWTAARFLRLPDDGGSDLFDDFRLVQGATLTLLGLIIGFTFSMAVARYDQRKSLEEEEANAIGTEYARADLLPAATATTVRNLLAAYLEQRILFYTIRGHENRVDADARSARLQADMWAAVAAAATAQPNPVTALAVTGMNDVLNAQGYAEAMSRNRIPAAAWAMMSAIAICGTMLVGMGARSEASHSRFLLALPLVVSIAFFMIADIDTPRGGVIKVSPQNLLTLQQSLKPR